MTQPTPLPVLLNHIAQALSLQAVWCRQNGLMVPTELVVWAEQARLWASAVQSGPEVPNPLTDPDAARVSAPLLLSLPSAADELGVSLSTLKRLVNDGSLRSVLVGGTRRIRRCDLEDYVDRLVGGRHIETKSTPDAAA